MHAVSYMKGLSILVGDIGAGKTTLARRMLDSLPEDEYEAALLVIIHSGITANWLLKRIALQLGRGEPGAGEAGAARRSSTSGCCRSTSPGKKAVVLIDEAQMLETREMMEEFRGLLNLEVPERKLHLLRLLRPAGDRAEPEARPAARPARGAPLQARALHRRVDRGVHQAPAAAGRAARGCPSPPEAVEAVHRHSRRHAARHQHPVRQRAVRGVPRAAGRHRRRSWSTASGRTWASGGSAASLAAAERGKRPAPRPLACAESATERRSTWREIDRYLEGLGKL